MHPHAEEPGRRAPSLVFVAATALVLGGAWALDLFVIRTHLLATWNGQDALVPLYAFWSPAIGPRATIFAALAIALVALAARVVDPSRVRRSTFALFLLAAALALPFALFLVRQDPAQLGREFVYYQNDEFFFDARRIVGVGDFVAHYVELMPRLSLHGQHFPPGHALFLFAVGRVFGESTLAAGIACWVCSALAIVVAYVALGRLAHGAEVRVAPSAVDRLAPNTPERPAFSALDRPALGAPERLAPGREKAARQGALLLLAAPSMLDFACTSMDAVFLLVASIAWAIGVRALGPDGRRRDAIATGAALFLATCFSFSALPLGLVLGLFAVIFGRADLRGAATRLAFVGASYIGAAIALDLVTGFSILDCFFAARAAALEFMTHAAGRPPGELWLGLSFGNALAFALGAGLALVPSAVASVLSAPRTLRPWDLAALAALGLMTCGGIYFLETERIWLFALPWLAAIAVSRAALAPATLRLVLAAGLAQALAMEVLLHTLW